MRSGWIRVVFVVCFGLVGSAYGQAGIYAGFSKLPVDAKVVLMPLDVELFSISGGGVFEPQAEWTNNAVKNLKTAFSEREAASKVKFSTLSEDPDEAIDDLNRLHGAVGMAINNHYLGALKLPTKEGKFDWSMGNGVDAVFKKTGADYALFTFIRDGYASSERIATMVIGALLGVGLPGGFQVGYASLVDLRTGQVVWFNRLIRTSGDLREVGKAKETLNALLDKFPS